MLTLYHLLDDLHIFLFDMFCENDNYLIIRVLNVTKTSLHWNLSEDTTVNNGT